MKRWMSGRHWGLGGKRTGWLERPGKGEHGRPGKCEVWRSERPEKRAKVDKSD